MRFPLVPVIVLLLFNGFIDFCIWRIIKNFYKRPVLAKIQWISAIIFAIVLLWIICMPKRNGGESSFTLVMWTLYGYLTIYFPKYIFLIFHFIAQLPRIWKQAPSRVVSFTGVIIAIIVFLTMWWGALFNRYNIEENFVEVPVANLPPEFQDFTIAQISDLHLGTFGEDTAFVHSLVQRINNLHPDIIVFTGDMVSRNSEEMRPFVNTLSKLKAPYGIYSILGNHDYGDYSDWNSAEDKVANHKDLKDMQAQAGLIMLNNESHWIKKQNDSIAIIGVENIGDPPFKVYGDLKTAYPNINDENVKILLTHNPAHWESEIEDKETNVALTLSGHTHAMQISLFGVSPASLRYKRWGGAYYDSKGQMLYVNIGAGTVGMPYRIGANPEITLFTLK